MVGTSTSKGVPEVKIKTNNSAKRRKENKKKAAF